MAASGTPMIAPMVTWVLTERLQATAGVAAQPGW